MSGGGSVSSKSITITWRIYPAGMLACLSALCLHSEPLCVHLLLLGAERLEGIERKKKYPARAAIFIGWCSALIPVFSLPALLLECAVFSPKNRDDCVTITKHQPL